MRKSLIATLTIALTFAAAAAVSAGPKQVPAQIALARYVCLGYDTGDRFLSEREAISMPYDVYPEDRKALEDILGKGDPAFVVIRDSRGKLEKELLSTGSLNVLRRQEMGTDRSLVLLTNRPKGQ